MNATTHNKEHFNIYEEITKRIVMSLAKGEIPWRKRWCSPSNESDTVNFATGKPYSLLNRMLLGEPGKYIGFSQAKEKGGTVRKGAKSKMVVFYKMFIPKENKEEAERLQKEGKDISHLQIPVLKYSNVFNVKDVDGLKIEEETTTHAKAANPTDKADYIIDEYCSAEKISVSEEPRDSFVYDSEADTIAIPARTQFATEEQWYNTLFSGLVQSTAKENRCNRKTAATKDESVPVKEELVNEIGASMIMSSVELENKESMEDTLAECNRWMDALNKDFRLIVNASSQAEKAAKYILRPLL